MYRVSFVYLSYIFRISTVYLPCINRKNIVVVGVRSAESQREVGVKVESIYDFGQNGQWYCRAKKQ